MSHTVEIRTKISNLIALERACDRMNLKFARGETKYRTYGSPKACSHTISLQNDTKEHQIGLVAEGENFNLHFDWYGQSKLPQVVGQDCGRLIMNYGLEAAKGVFQSQGHEVFEKVEEDGSLTLQALVGV